MAPLCTATLLDVTSEPACPDGSRLDTAGEEPPCGVAQRSSRAEDSDRRPAPLRPSGDSSIADVRWSGPAAPPADPPTVRAPAAATSCCCNAMDDVRRSAAARAPGTNAAAVSSPPIAPAMEADGPFCGGCCDAPAVPVTSTLLSTSASLPSDSGGGRDTRRVQVGVVASRPAPDAAMTRLPSPSRRRPRLGPARGSDAELVGGSGAWASCACCALDARFGEEERLGQLTGPLWEPEMRVWKLLALRCEMLSFRDGAARCRGREAVASGLPPSAASSPAPAAAAAAGGSGGDACGLSVPAAACRTASAASLGSCSPCGTCTPGSNRGVSKAATPPTATPSEAPASPPGPCTAPTPARPACPCPCPCPGPGQMPAGQWK